MFPVEYRSEQFPLLDEALTIVKNSCYGLLIACPVLLNFNVFYGTHSGLCWKGVFYITVHLDLCLRHCGWISTCRYSTP